MPPAPRAHRCQRKMKFETEKIELANRRAVGIIFLVQGGTPPITRQSRRSRKMSHPEEKRQDLSRNAYHISMIPITLLWGTNFYIAARVAIPLIGSAALRFGSSRGSGNELTSKKTTTSAVMRHSP